MVASLFKSCISLSLFGVCNETPDSKFTAIFLLFACDVMQTTVYMRLVHSKPNTDMNKLYINIATIVCVHL